MKRLWMCGAALLIGGLAAANLSLLYSQDVKNPKKPMPKAVVVPPNNIKPPKLVTGKNLLANGDFEEGDDTPKGWQKVDNLTSFYVKDTDPKHGKCIKFDSDVLQSQAYDWWYQLHRKGKTLKDMPAKKPVGGAIYDTIGGLDGCFFWSDPVPVEKGKAYWLTIDSKGPGFLAWLFGYPEKPDTAFAADMGAIQDYFKQSETGKPLDKGREHEIMIHKYKWKGQIAVGGGADWTTSQRRGKPFRPTSPYPDVKYVRVMLLPLWPNATYYVDNVCLYEVKTTASIRPRTNWRRESSTRIRPSRRTANRSTISPECKRQVSSKPVGCGPG